MTVFSLDGDFYPWAYLFQDADIADNSTEYRDRTCRADFIAFADRSRAKEDAKCVSLGPVTQVSDINQFFAIFQFQTKRDWEIYFITPEINVALDR